MLVPVRVLRVLVALRDATEGKCVAHGGSGRMMDAHAGARITRVLALALAH
jgi:hypothetical protein